MSAPTIKLKNDREIPALGLGTWQITPEEVGEVVKAAIKMGYRHIDCAMLYDNEAEIGVAINEMIKEEVVTRKELFITTKLWNTFHERDQVADACRISLGNLGLDYVDLYLVHWPVALKPMSSFNVTYPFAGAEGYDYDYVNTWKGMEECFQIGLTKSIGISNFNREQIDRILNQCVIKPVVHQFEVNLFNNQKKMIDYCRKRDIVVVAYSPFASPKRAWASPLDPTVNMEDVVLVDIGLRHNKSVTQVLLRHLIQLGVVPIPKSTNEEHLRENLDVFNFVLSDDEMGIVDAFNTDFRSVGAEEMKDMPHYPFHKWI